MDESESGAELKRSIIDDENATATDEGVEAKKPKLDDEELDGKTNESATACDSAQNSAGDGEAEIKVERTDGTPPIGREANFTSEIFKIEIMGLPRHVGYGQLRKFLSKLGLEPKKVRTER